MALIACFQERMKAFEEQAKIRKSANEAFLLDRPALEGRNKHAFFLKVCLYFANLLTEHRLNKGQLLSVYPTLNAL